MAKGNSVRQIAQGRWRAILIALGIEEVALTGKPCPCPLCGGRDRFRFDDKEGRGTYFCSGCRPGDGMQLALAFTGLEFKELAKKIEGLAGAVPSNTHKPELSNKDKLKALRKVCAGSVPIQRGDEAERYLRGRGLMLPHLPASVRVHPGLHYWDGGKVVGTYPVMLATVTAPTGEPVTFHRTYVEDGRKAPVQQPKKLMPGLSLEGAAIRLFPVAENLGIAEGIETALAAAELFKLPVWSCISAGGIESFIPPAGVKAVTIFADNDLTYTGQAAACNAAKRLAREGYQVNVEIPDAPGDWLDVLQAAVSENTEEEH